MMAKDDGATFEGVNAVALRYNISNNSFMKICFAEK
jgi:hypothetical protein